ncbi:MAG TPA: orotidine 5'-phosphate decarboxylase / HUMPS family protein [Pseudonocardiaceae bacterium]|nr:orotidine 5'-phosphate decarboxylase / HUMPS family protein [Pseudonocardiaceae bacterium]
MSAQNRSAGLKYVDSTELAGSVRMFLTHAAHRVFVLKGGAGRGKTRFVSELAQQLQDEVYLQLHWMSTFDLASSSLAEEVLRYASIPSGKDGLLALEQAVAGLDRTFFVVIDGLAAQKQVDELGAHLERILRQISTHRLRFLLAVRTPPDVDLSQFPVLAASVYEPISDRPGTSGIAPRWTPREAARAWSVATQGGAVAFSDLPASVRDLATIPLYLRLMIESGEVETLTGATAYRLVDHSVRSIIRRSRFDPAEIHHNLTRFAATNLSDTVPSRLRRETDRPPANSASFPLAATLAPLLESSSVGQLGFAHEVLGEYFVATHIAELIIEHGRSHTTVSAFNELSERGLNSATAYNVLEFTIFALDDRAPDLLTVIALAPSISADSALPPLLTAAQHSAQLTSSGVVRNAASRGIEGNHRKLVRVLLRLPRLAVALGEEYPTWLLNVIRNYGSVVWPAVAGHLWQFPEFDGATRFLAAVGMNRPDDAIFVARHRDLFGDDITAQQSRVLNELHGHLDWRVRAALADTLGESTVNPASTRHTATLARDPDYRVRAAVARAIGQTEGTVQPRPIRELLSDPNWHVRACLLQGALANPERADLLALISTVISEGASWKRPPFHVGKLTERLLILGGAIVHNDNNVRLTSRAHIAALFILLRETRSGSLKVSAATRRRLIEHGLASCDPFVVGEASRLAGNGGGAGSPREMYRRMRGSRSVQIALDLHDLGQALVVAAAVRTEADLIEVGDPLIKSVGVGAISAVKQQAPDVWIVAEMMSADWGRDQVELAVEAGADIVLLIGPATIASVSAAVDASRRLDVPLVLDIPVTQLTREWVRDMERTGVDGFTVTTNIDLGVGGHGPLDVAGLVRGWTRLPIAVSGGFGATDRAMASSKDWDIVIIGRGVSEAVDPGEASRAVISLIHDAK